VPKIAFAPNARNIGGDWLVWLTARISLDEATVLLESKRN
jgi:hypothetical protein